jgi:hypothetical protein
MKRHINARVRLDKKTGKIKEADARALESGLNTYLNGILISPTQHVSSVRASVGRVMNIQNPILVVTIRMMPLGCIREMIIDIGMENVALSM